jgi:RimJ/RimL family protein N-acetyltransferase
MLARLTDETSVLVRPIRPSDKPRLVEGLRRLSAESVHSRFLSPKPRFAASELVYLTEVDGHNHVAFVALLADDPSRLVAVGRYIRLADDPDAAEVAITVGDAWQRMGLGRRLGALLAESAQRNGVKRFTATMLADNVAAHRLLAAMTERLDTEHHGAVDELSVPLAA